QRRPQGTRRDLADRALRDVRGASPGNCFTPRVPTSRGCTPMTEPTIDTAPIDPTAGATADRTRLVGILLAGALVSVALGIYGREHAPTFERPFSLFFTDTINLKVW